jgi:serine/threonine protein kinase
MQNRSSAQPTLGPTGPTGTTVPRHIRRCASGTSWTVIDPASSTPGMVTVVKRYNVRFTRYLMRNATARQRLMRFEERPVPGLPKIVRIGMVNGQLTLLSEGMPGEPLALAISKRRVGADPAIAINIIVQLADALISMHRGGLVHGDINTSAIVVDANHGRAQFGDWGHVVPFGGENRHVETDGALDEQGNPIVESRLRPADDVYGLACVAYELLSGRHPYWHRTDAEATEFGLGPVPLVNVDAVTNDALMQALVRSTDARYISMQGLADVLKADSRVRGRLTHGALPRAPHGKAPKLTAITWAIIGAMLANE